MQSVKMVSWERQIFAPRNERTVRQGAFTPPTFLFDLGEELERTIRRRPPREQLPLQAKKKTLTGPLQPPIRPKNGSVFCDASTLGSSLEVIAFEFQVIGFFN